MLTEVNVLKPVQVRADVGLAECKDAPTTSVDFMVGDGSVPEGMEKGLVDLTAGEVRSIGKQEFQNTRCRSVVNKIQFLCIYTYIHDGMYVIYSCMKVCIEVCIRVFVYFTIEDAATCMDTSVHMQ